MNDYRFDELTKELAATPVSRRRALKLLLAGAATGLLSTVTTPSAYAARNCRDIGQTCQSDAQCCTRFCDNQNFRCACTPGTELCNGKCVGCQPPFVLNTSTCQCECPQGTTKCGNTCCSNSATPVCCANSSTCCPSGTQCTNVGTCCPSDRLCAGECCPPGFTCSNNQCVASPCGASNCPGCCQNNVCQPGNTDLLCGSGGNTCTTCTPPNVCCGGQCKRPNGAACSGNGNCCSGHCRMGVCTAT